MKKAKEENKRMTKKYFVAEVFSCGFSPSFKFSTDSREDAVQYAELMRRNNPDDEFVVLELIDGLTQRTEAFGISAQSVV